MPSPLILTSLPSDVLLEILKLLLLDTPRSPQRAAVLRTCTLLHDLGLPYLYRVVDLTGMMRKSTVIVHWERLFGCGGLFEKGTKSRRGVEVGSFVREIRLGAAEQDQLGRWEYYQLARLDLPRCSTLFFDLTHLQDHRCAPLKLFFSHLHVTNLILFYRPRGAKLGRSLPVGWIGGGEQHMEDLLGIQPEPSRTLERIVFRGCIWYESIWYDSFSPSRSPRLSFADLSFKVLVVELRPTSSGANVGTVVALFLDPPSEKDGRFLQEVERIELKILGKFASEMEQKFRVEVRRRVKRGLTLLERRLLPLFVSVGEDGMERSFAGLD